VSKTAKNRIEELERRQWEAEWSRVLVEFPNLTAYQLGQALDAARRCCKLPPSPVNLEYLSRGNASRDDLLELLHSVAPDIPAFVLRHAVQVQLIVDGATKEELEVLAGGGRPARLAPLIKAAEEDYEQARKAVNV
jgi:hypothetical protein